MSTEDNKAIARRLIEEAWNQGNLATVDELMAKVQREGVTSMSEEEKRFMKRVSDRYRNRQ